MNDTRLLTIQFVVQLTLELHSSKFNSNHDDSTVASALTGKAKRTIQLQLFVKKQQQEKPSSVHSQTMNSNINNKPCIR